MISVSAPRPRTTIRLSSSSDAMRAAIVIAEDAITESIIHFKPRQLSRSVAGPRLGAVPLLECFAIILLIMFDHGYAFVAEAARLDI